MGRAEIQIGDVKMTASTYKEVLSGIPSMYEVHGLPVGQRALIALFGRTWRFLRIAGDVPDTWAGSYDSPRAALAALAHDVNAEPFTSDPTMLQPHDGVAKQDEAGRWSVYRVEPDRRLRFLDGPFEKQEAIGRLRELVPISEGDQWAVDVWGVAHTLN